MKPSRAVIASEPRVRGCPGTWPIVHAVVWLGLVLAGLTGCAVHYYDPKTGTEHLWGFGHLKMRAVPRQSEHPPFTNAPIAYVTGVRTLGLNLGAGQEFAGLAAGWDSRSRVVIVAENAHFCLLWPTNTIWWPYGLRDLFTLRIGDPPTNFLFQSTTTSSHP